MAVRGQHHGTMLQPKQIKCIEHGRFESIQDEGEDN
jgi:hypothetical protein